MSDDTQTDVKESQDSSTENETKETAEERAQRLEAENNRLKENLRKQSKKRGSGQDTSDDTDDEDDVDEIDARINEVVNQRLTERFEGSVSQWMEEQEWAKRYASENDPEGKETARFNTALKTVNDLYPVTTAEDMKENYARAHALVAGESVSRPASEGERAADETTRQAASGAGGSTIRRSQDGSGRRLNAKERTLLDKFGVPEEKRKNL